MGININMIKKILYIAEISLKFYPFVFTFFMLLDINVFCFLFGFKPGYLVMLLSEINFSNFPIILLFMFIPIALIFIFCFGIFLSFQISNKIVKNKYFTDSILNEWYFKYICFISMHFVFIYGTVNLLNLSYSNSNNLFLLYILLTLIISIYMGVARGIMIPLRTFSNFQFKKLLFPLFNISLLIFFIWKFRSEEFSAYSIMSILFLVAFILALIYSKLNLSMEREENNIIKLYIEKENNIKSKNNKDNLSNILFVIFIIIFVFAFCEYANQKEWSKQINNKNTTIHNFHFNFLFNRALLIQNGVDFTVDIPLKIFNEIKSKLSKDICINKSFSVLEKGKIPETIRYQINDTFWYLDIFGNKKIFFKNVYTYEKVKGGYDRKNIGYLILLIEERKYTNDSKIYYSFIDKKIYFYNK